MEESREVKREKVIWNRYLSTISFSLMCIVAPARAEPTIPVAYRIIILQE